MTEAAAQLRLFILRKERMQMRSLFFFGVKKKNASGIQASKRNWQPQGESNSSTKHEKLVSYPIDDGANHLNVA